MVIDNLNIFRGGRGDIFYIKSNKDGGGGVYKGWVYRQTSGKGEQ